MNKITVYKGIILLLVLLNTALIAFIVMGPRKGPKRPPRDAQMAMESIQKNFDFDDQQMEQFLLSRNKHAAKTRDLTRKLKAASLAYYQNGDPNKKDSLFQVADQYSDAIYLANDTHFEEVRAICRPDQLPRVKTFIGALMGRENDKGGQPRKK